jgi:hypothetical protein
MIIAMTEIALPSKWWVKVEGLQGEVAEDR